MGKTHSRHLEWMECIRMPEQSPPPLVIACKNVFSKVYNRMYFTNSKCFVHFASVVYTCYWKHCSTEYYPIDDINRDGFP